jgi:catabolite repression HPr-like protein
MITKKMAIDITADLDKRPIAKLVQEASRFSSSVFFEYRDKKVNAKSIMGMMSLGLNMGEEVKVEADGPDEDKAVEKLELYLSGQEA